ncbi:MAG: thiamine-phosphate kinase [candidate division Zixibacteria bacterium]|nr:thiamine-phosphate kinase [candidate division Zixibacteria bacterium]
MAKISDIGEFGLIGRFEKLFKVPGNITRGIGDDCAVIKENGSYLILTADALVEDVHFKLEYTPPRMLGYKSLAVNLSDLAAMASEPTAAIVTLAAPRDTDSDFVMEFARGMNECARKYDCPVIGGDTTGSKKHIFINVAVIGETKTEPVMRSGAGEGDLIAVAGNIGESSAGLELLIENAKGRKLSWGDKIFKKRLARAHLKPEPMVKEALEIRKVLKPTSMIDISDGLSSELNHISRASGVKLVIDSGKVPIGRSLSDFCRDRSIDPQQIAIKGGEDYALLFTFKKKQVDKIRSLKLNAPVNVIGEVSRGRGVYMRRDNKLEKLTSRSYTHF